MIISFKILMCAMILRKFLQKSDGAKFNHIKMNYFKVLLKYTQMHHRTQPVINHDSTHDLLQWSDGEDVICTAEQSDSNLL